MASADRLTACIETLVLDHLPERLPVDRLAELLGMERTTLYRQLRRHGTSPSDVARAARLSHAAALLAEGESVFDAAFASGYAEPSAFTRAFQRRYGMNPSDWPSGG